MSDELLRVQGLRVGYRHRDEVREVVHGVDLTLHRGEVLAVVGESGSGKSTLAHAIIGLLPETGEVLDGQVLLNDLDLTTLNPRALTRIRGTQIGLVPQDPGMSLNPVHRVGDQVAEALLIHRLAKRKAAHQRAIELLEMVGLPQPTVTARQYPHQLSGGMRQRVLIAIALACEPPLVIADEPTSALDVTVQRTVLDEFAAVTVRSNTAVLFITHDLAVAADRADRVVVMQAGQIVETGTVAEVLGNPTHEYTQRLLAAAPTLTSPVLINSVAPVDEPDEPVLALQGITKDFSLPGRGTLRAVDDVSFGIRPGETVGLVGESGSGKSTTARIAMQLERPTAGRVLFDGQDITGTRGEALRRLRQEMQLVYQNPYASLNPRFSIEQVITEPLHAFRVGDASERRARAQQLLVQVALPADTLQRKPAELSGGQRQRVAIARALALRPRLVVLDEPVSALDVSVQAQILELLVDLQHELGLSYLFISHDLAVVRLVSHHIGVMRRGELVEWGAADQIFTDPRHEYTQELLAAIPGQHGPDQ